MDDLVLRIQSKLKYHDKLHCDLEVSFRTKSFRYREILERLYLAFSQGGTDIQIHIGKREEFDKITAEKRIVP